MEITDRIFWGSLGFILDSSLTLNCIFYLQEQLPYCNIYFIYIVNLKLPWDCTYRLLLVAFCHPPTPKKTLLETWKHIKIKFWFPVLWHRHAVAIINTLSLLCLNFENKMKQFALPIAFLSPIFYLLSRYATLPGDPAGFKDYQIALNHPCTRKCAPSATGRLRLFLASSDPGRIFPVSFGSRFLSTQLPCRISAQ